MICLFDKKENCCGCTACMNVCPNGAITMTEDEEGFLYPVINPDLCTECKACVKVCAIHKKEYKEKFPTGQIVYAAKHIDEDVRERSASGGAFTAISDTILEQKGIIYGAVFTDKFKVIHTCAENEDQRNRMRGSKYVQSSLGTIFKDIKNNLDKGRLVLFTGTPCQNDGLKRFLGDRKYDNLVLCDIVCHGVPSPLLWEDYKKYLENKYQDKISNVIFRCKDTGWHNSSIKVEFSNCYHRKDMTLDPYYILFFSHISMRPSCHHCAYANYHRVTDITIADFWGIERTDKTFTDDRGVSLMLVNTLKGQEIVDKIRKNLMMAESDHKSSYQPIFEGPSKSSDRRAEFWREYLAGERFKVIEKYGKLSIIQRIIKKIIVPVLKKTGLFYFAEKIYYRK